jgi:hypothetical protein
VSRKWLEIFQPQRNPFMVRQAHHERVGVPKNGYIESVYKLQPDVLQYVTPEYGKNQVAGEMGRDEDTE